MAPEGKLRIVRALQAAGTLLTFHWELQGSGSLAQAQTVALTTMVFFQLFHVGNSRSERLSLFQKSPFSNRFLFVSTAGSLAVHVAALYLAPTQRVLRVAPLLEWQTWMRMVAVAASILVAMELHELLRRPRPARSRRSRTLGPRREAALGRA